MGQAKDPKLQNSNKQYQPKKYPGSLLGDHKKVGKRLIPPLLQDNKFEFVSWKKFFIPEFLWLGLLIAKFGYLDGLGLALLLSNTAIKTNLDNGLPKLFVSISSFDTLSVEQKNEMVKILRESGRISLFNSAFRVFIHFYPKCPLNFLFQKDEVLQSNNVSDLSELKVVLNSLFDRGGVESTFVQAGVIYISIMTDILKLQPDSLLLQLPCVQDYPNTDESQIVASLIRATINGVVGDEFSNNPSSWPIYFWNRGFELESCTLQQVERYGSKLLIKYH